MTNTTSMPTEPETLPRFDPAYDEISSEVSFCLPYSRLLLIYRQIWTSVEVFLNQPGDVKHESNRFQYLIATLGRIADGVATEHKSKEGALTPEISRALLDVSEMPLFHERTKRNNQETTSIQPKKAKTTPVENMHATNTAAPATPSSASASTDKITGATTARAPPFPLSPFQ